MSRPGWELASGGGGAKDTGLVALFKGASLVRKNGEAVSVLAALKDKTVFLYFAAAWAEPCKPFNNLLSKFYELVRETDDSIVVIFVSNDKSKEEQVAFFRDSGMHPEWLMVEWTYDLQDIMDNFNVEKIPGLIVVDREGKAVVEDARDQLFDVFGDARGKPLPAETVKEAVAVKWAQWRRLAGDWRASGGYTLGSSSGNTGPSAPGLGSGLVQAGSGGQSDREALRAARLAALERRMGASASVGEGGSSSSCGGGAVSSAGAAVASSASQVHMAAPTAASTSGPRIASLGARSTASSSGTTGSGTFASGAAGAPQGGTAYTLAGGKVELPPPAEVQPFAGDADDDMASDMASDGGASAGADGVEDVDPEQAALQIVAMGFPLERAREALEAARGNLDEAVALLVGDA